MEPANTAAKPTCPAGYTTASSWACARCYDAGWLVAEGDVHGEVARLVRCPDCRESASDERSRRAAAALGGAMGDRLRACRLDTFRTDRQFGQCEWLGHQFTAEQQRASLVEAVAACRQFLNTDEHWALTLHGSYGAGKTHLAAGVANEMVSTSDVGWWRGNQLGDWLRSGYDAGDYDQRMEQVCSCRLLVIDDLGVERATDWLREKLDQIIDYRWINQLPTVITSNYAPSRLPARIAARLAGGRVVLLVASDYRGGTQ